MKTLVVAPNWIGDALMAQPLLTLLKRDDPAQRIVALAPRWVAPVLEAMPEVDDVIATDLAHGALQWSRRRAFAKQIAMQGFDRAFILPNSFKSALVPWLARIPERIGYRGEMRYGLVNRRADGPPAASPAMSARYAALAGVASVAMKTPLPAALPSPRLIVDDAVIAAVRARFGFDAADQLIALCPGAEYGPAKRWPADHFASLAQSLLAARPDAHVLLLGGKGDRATAEEIIAKASVADAPSRLHNLAGATDLAEAVALIAASDQIVSNDSGLMHVAAALARPQVAIFGSSDPRHTPPLSARAKTLWLHLDCSPCFERTCPLGHLNCLVGITPQRVLDSMQNDSVSPPTASA
ncbi:MAG: lipopolysaccharide heptosyltransferase II [Burkholderiaceae bacterium]